MVAMPYIVVNLVLELFSFVLFCMTSAALLSKYPLTNRYLPARLRNHRTLSFVAHGLVLSALSIAVLLVVARGRPVFLAAQFIFEWFFGIGVANSAVLTYQFLDRRYLLHTPKVLRRLLFAICAVVMTCAAALGVLGAAVRLFVIR